MHASGVTLEEIGDYVGHSSTYMTDRYRHLIEGQREAAATSFDEYAARELDAVAPRASRWPVGATIGRC